MELYFAFSGYCNLLLAKALLPAFKSIERYTIRSASAVNLVSGGFVQYFSRYKSPEDLRIFPNGVDSEFLDYEFIRTSGRRRRTQILFAGNIGESQGLHKVIPAAARLLHRSHEFLVIGDGGMRAALLESVDGLDNVNVVNPVERRQLLAIYAETDILFVHLNDYDAFKKVLPSKIFEYAATGKPVLAGLGGYSANFTNENVENAAVFPPCDANGLVEAVGRLSLEHVERTTFINQYSRSRIMAEMANDIICTYTLNVTADGNVQVGDAS